MSLELSNDFIVCITEAESQRTVIAAPQPEAAIENGACRARLLKHLQRCQALIDARLDSIEAQVAGRPRASQPATSKYLSAS